MVLPRFPYETRKEIEVSTVSGKWSTELLGGHEIYLFEPAQRNEHGYVLLYLHGVHLGRLSEKPRFIEQFERFGLPIAAPVTQRSWWTDKICGEFDANITAERHVLDRVLPFVRERWGAEPPRIGLFGTSMGGQGALRLSYKHPNVFPVVAAVSPAVDYHLRVQQGDQTLSQMYAEAEAARQDTALLHIHPLNWPRHQFFCCDPTDADWFDGADRLRMKLGSLGIPFECDLETENGGHGFEYYNSQAERVIGFLYERLERERRRVV